jgi:hypothetical protein
MSTTKKSNDKKSHEVLRRSEDGAICMVYCNGQPLRCPTEQDYETLPEGEFLSDDDIEALDC